MEIGTTSGFNRTVGNDCAPVHWDASLPCERSEQQTVGAPAGVPHTRAKRVWENSSCSRIHLMM